MVHPNHNIVLAAPHKLQATANFQIIDWIDVSCNNHLRRFNYSSFVHGVWQQRRQGIHLIKISQGDHGLREDTAAVKF